MSVEPLGAARATWVAGDQAVVLGAKGETALSLAGGTQPEMAGLVRGYPPGLHLLSTLSRS